MMRRFLLMFSLAAALSTAPYALHEGDTLRIGNGCIERAFLWNDGALRTVGLTDGESGHRFASEAGQPDFTLPGHRFGDGRMETRQVPSQGNRPACLLVTVFSRSASLEVRREYRVYEGVPAIACDTYLRGSLSALEGGGDNAADRKNIESAADMAVKAAGDAVLDRLQPAGKHWHCKAVEFTDVTDWNDNLVKETSFIAYRKLGYRGNLLFARDTRDGPGFFFLKEAPCSGVQIGTSRADFQVSEGSFQAVGAGILPADVDPEHWTRLYGCVTGVFGEGELPALTALRRYQKAVRRSEDMVMMNTWGDRSQDSKVNEAFCLAELERAARLGISIFQIDDGWQSGKSPNSKVAKGSFRNIWDNPDYWTPDPQKYPRGLEPVVDRARELGLEVGLWYNPSVQDSFADWEKDAAALLGLYRQYGIRIFKIDGLQVPDKKAEENLRKLFDHVSEESGGRVIFNLDATAGRRMGYQYFGEYGNIFLENRYTDWGNYYPYRTLRNLWQLSRYVPAECLQVEFLNPWRNPDKYPSGDRFAPANHSFDYLASLTFAGQPLAWMEASNLPDQAFGTGTLLRGWRAIAGELHGGVILPVGEEPSGESWTGFQSILDSRHGYLLLYREQTPSAEGRVKTWLPEGARVTLEPVLGEGRRRTLRVETGGYIRIRLKEMNTSSICKYTVK